MSSARLETLQGEVVPVHLGLARLDQGYASQAEPVLPNVMLMSWGGEVAADASMVAADLAVEVRTSAAASCSSTSTAPPSPPPPCKQDNKLELEDRRGARLAGSRLC